MIYEGVEYEISEAYSFKDMTGWNLSDRKDMDGIVVYASCLSNETPDAMVLPAKLKDCTFIKCNLDNVHVPEGNVVIDCNQRRFKCQNDGEDWIIDTVEKKPVEPLNKKHFIKAGLSVDPKDIPAQKLDVSVLQMAAIEGKL